MGARCIFAIFFLQACSPIRMNPDLAKTGIVTKRSTKPIWDTPRAKYGKKISSLIVKNYKGLETYSDISYSHSMVGSSSIPSEMVNSDRGQKDHSSTKTFNMELNKQAIGTYSTKSNGIIKSNIRRRRGILGVNGSFPGPCASLGSCAASSKHDVWFCSCDEDCVEYGDCCHDYTQVAKKSKYVYKCNAWSTIPKDPRTFRYGFQSIQKCPENFKNGTIADLCANGNMTVAGTYVAATKSIAFRNKFCAFCHNFTDIEYFDIQLNLKSRLFNNFENVSKEELLEIITHSRDYWFISPPSSNIRQCAENLKRSNASDLCDQFINPILAGNTIYRNVYCTQNQDKDIKCLEERDLVQDDFDHKSPNENFMSILFSFYPKDDETKCKTWNEKTSADNSCKGMTVFTNTQRAIILYWMLSNNLTLGELDRLVGTTEWLFWLPGVAKMVSMVWQIETSLQIVKVQLTVQLMKSSFLHEANAFYEKIKSRQITYHLDSGHNNGPVTAQLVSELPASLRNMTTQFVKFRMWYSVGETLLQRMAAQNISLNDQIPDMLVDSCDIWATLSQFQLKVTNVKCTGQKTEQNVSVANIIMYICFAVSIISLLTSIIVQRKYGLISNVPSSNMENISASLLLSNGLFVFAIETTSSGRICYVVGVCLHFLWLSVFSFMSVSVIYIAKTMRNISTRTNTSTNRSKQILFTAIGLVVPLLLVITTVCVDWFGSSSWSVEYGEYPCFPSRYPTSLVFVSAPIVLTITVNLFCLIYIVANLCITRLEVSHVRKFDPVAEGIVYLRLCVVSGVLWILGIFDALLENEWVTYCFTIFCGLQGCFIALSNMTSARFKQRQTKRQTRSTPIKCEPKKDDEDECRF